MQSGIPQKLTPAQIEQTVEDNGAVYKQEMIENTFRSRVQGFWAGSALGLLSGLAVGAAVAASTALVLPLAAVATIAPTVIGAFALATMALGATLMTSVNASAGAATELAKINDRKRLHSLAPGESVESAQYKGAPKTPTKLFNLKTTLIFSGLAVAAAAVFLSIGGVGLLTAATGVIGAHLAAPAAAAILAEPAVATCIGITTAGLFGASFGVNYPPVAAKLTQAISNVFSGKKLNYGIEFANIAQQDSCRKPVTPQPVCEKVTPEDMAKLNEKMNVTASARTFVQTVNDQQTQSAYAGAQT